MGLPRQLTLMCKRVKQKVRSLPGGRAALCRGFSLNTILASSVHSCKESAQSRTQLNAGWIAEDAKGEWQTGKLADNNPILQKDMQIAEPMTAACGVLPSSSSCRHHLLLVSGTHNIHTGPESAAYTGKSPAYTRPHLLLVCQKRRACLTHEPDLAELVKDDPSVEIHEAK